MTNRSWASATLLAASFAAAVAASVPAFASNPKHVTVRFDRPMHVGTTLLQPGRYDVAHQITDDGHALVFRQSGATVASIACRIVPATKAKWVELYTANQPNGTAILTQLRIGGESTGHVIESPSNTAK